MKNRVLLEVRHNKGRSVVAHCVEEFSPLGRGAIRLLRVTPDSGPLPDSIGQLYGEVFEDRRELRRAIINLMKESHNGNQRSS